MSRIDPLDRLSRAAEEAIGGDDPRVATFARGLVIGALVGAAIAGSTLWQRRRRPVATPTEAPDPVATSPEAPDPTLAQDG